MLFRSLLIQKIGSEYGLSPASRSRIKLSEPAKEENDFEKFLAMKYDRPEQDESIDNSQE